MSDPKTQPYTIVLESNSSLGPGVEIVHEEAADASEAALRALHKWLGESYDPETELNDLEMRAYVLAVLRDRAQQALRRVPPGRLTA